MANIKFEYLYRDENNYKEYGDVILNNLSNLSLETIQKYIYDNLTEGIWFNPDNWEIPIFSFHRVSIFGTNDHLWYEFAAITETKKDVTTTTEIDEFIVNIKKK